MLPELGRVIVGVEMPLRSSHPDPYNFLSRARSKAIRFLKNQLHLTAVTLRDAKFGGATDASFVFGFGNQLHGRSVPSEVPHVGYVLRHYLDGGAKGWFDRCRSEDLPVLPDDTEHVVWGNSQLIVMRRVKFGPNPDGDSDHFTAGTAGRFIRPEGLFPCADPLVSVACPCYFAKGKLSMRSLTVPELLRLYQLPLHMDDFFQQFRMSSALPFEQAASPVIYTSIFRQLWGVAEGGLSGDSHQREASVPIELDEEAVEDVTDAAAIDGGNTLDDGGDTLDDGGGILTDSAIDAGTLADLDDAGVALTDNTIDAGTLTDLDDAGDALTDAGREDILISGGAVLQQRMTANDNVLDHMLEDDTSVSNTTPSAHTTSTTVLSTPITSVNNGDDTSSSASVATVVDQQWQFEFEQDLEPIFSHQDDLSDDSTLTSVMSAETLQAGSAGKGGCFKHPFYKPGPPFPVGDIIFCIPLDRPNREGQRGFVIESDHPRYRIQLEDGTLIDQIMGSRTTGNEFSLFAHFHESLDAQPSPDPFAQIRADTLSNKGSFGMVHDSLLDSLRRVREEKEHAKAVKADDARVPVEYWNDSIKPFASPEKREQTLAFYRSRGWSKFVRHLTSDCASYLSDKYGGDWKTQPRKKNGKLTPLGVDQHAICHIIWHATNTTWFEYLAGTRLIHFRFPKRYRSQARDGVPIFFESSVPESKSPQKPFGNPSVKAQVRAKIEKALHRRYMIHSGITLRAFIKYFGVPKGEFDIRVVYDGTASGLNDALWVPSFWLPTSESVVRGLGPSSYMADRDVGDCFLNYQLHHSAVPYTGVDLNPIYEPGEMEHARTVHFDRNGMGMKPSPYNSCRMGLVVEEVCKGNRKNTNIASDGKEENPFQWDSIRLNLPGPGYDPSLAWVSKLRKDGQLAADVYTFVDDERLVAPTRELAFQASHVLASKQAYLGIIDSARKVRPPSKTPGAWAGSVIHVVDGLGVCLLVSEEKWLKLKSIIDKWINLLQSGETLLSHSDLLSDRGFLVYVTRTYPPMMPYLKGLHLAIEMWRGGRDSEGWKLPIVSSSPTALEDSKDDDSTGSAHSISSLDITRAGKHGLDLNQHASFDLDQPLDHEDAAVAYSLRRVMDRLPSTDTPEEVTPIRAPKSGLTPTVPRLLTDLYALKTLTSSELPVLRVVRPTMVVQVFYGFGDAAGKGFGATVAGNFNCQSKLSETSTSRDGLNYRLGVWNQVEELESSNWKEFTNLVDTTEEEAEAGRLRNCEFFLFTDNSTAESCFYRGSSTSKKLHGLVVRLRSLEMKYGLLIHLIHVSGKRMIAQGTDGCSRGFLMEGVMAGDNMLSFVDLGKSADERFPPVVDWIRSWSGQDEIKPLSPEGWYEEGHGITGGAPDKRGVYIPHHEPRNQWHLWCPPPAAADAAMEELSKARHKRTDTFHLVAIPRLMAPRWRRLFNKVCDFSFVVSPGTSFWPEGMFEPLWVGIILPFTHHRPWCLKRAPLLVEMGIELRGLLPESEAAAGTLLRKLCNLPKRLSSVPKRVACGVLHMPGSGSLSDGED